MSQPQHGTLKRQKTSFTPDNIPLRVLYQCYFFSNGLVMLILAILSYSSFDDGWTQYNLILENWQQPLITDIRATNQSCLSTEVQLTQYIWPGTSSGCQCDSIFGGSGLRSGSCSSNQTRRGCRTIGSINSVKMSNFPIDNFTYYTLCAQVDKNNTFYKNAPDKPCQSNQLKCGNQDDYFVCSNTNRCPIFDVSPTNNYTEGNISLPDGNQFYYTRQLAGQMPVVQFGIGEGSGLCIDSSDPSITKGRSDYTLMSVKKQDCSRDSRYTRLASTSEPTFYKVNNLDYLPNVLPGYSISSQYTWGIFKRGYILWKYSCRGDTLKSFIDSRADLDQILGYQNGQLIIAIIFFIVISIGMSIMVLVNICGGDWPCISGKGTEEANKLLKCEITMKVICQLAYAIIIFISFSLVRDKYNYLEQLVGKNCTDQQTTGVLNLLIESLYDKIYVYNVVLLVLFIVSIIVDLCALGYFYKNYKLTMSNQNFDQTATLNNNNGVIVNQELPITGQPGYFPPQQYGQPGYQEQYQGQPIQQYGQPGYQDQPPFQGQPMQGYPPGYQPVNQQPYQQPFVQQPYQAPIEQQYLQQQQYPQQYPQQANYGNNQAPQGNPFQ